MGTTESLSPAQALDEMRRLSTEYTSLSRAQQAAGEAEMAGVMASVLRDLAEHGDAPHSRTLMEIVHEWDMRDEYPRCPECRGPADEHYGPDETGMAECADGCGWMEVR